MQQQLFDKYKMRSGRMLIYEGNKLNKVMLSGYQGMFELPFDVGLDDFRVEYYKPLDDLSPLMPKDFFSDVCIIENGKIVKRGTIEVNKPLYHGGYFFHQTSYDDEGGRYTILTVTSDNGLLLVFGGYLFLILGLIGRCWIVPANRRLKKK
jgi:cytochrome c biogenesis protein ResB